MNRYISNIVIYTLFTIFIAWTPVASHAGVHCRSVFSSELQTSEVQFVQNLRPLFQYSEAKYNSVIVSIQRKVSALKSDDKAESKAMAAKLEKQLLLLEELKLLLPVTDLTKAQAQNLFQRLADFYIDSDTQLAILSKQDVIALKLYTGGDYKSVNTELRNTLGKPRQLQLFIKTIDEALAKLPKFKGYVLRGVHFSPQLLEQYQLGAVVKDYAFLSTSSTDIKGFESNVELKILSKSGRDISLYSRNQIENEVLFPRETSFKVQSRVVEGKITKFFLEEVE